MDVPTNCKECEHTNTCRAYYGGGLCKYRSTIEEKKLSRERESYQK